VGIVPGLICSAVFLVVMLIGLLLWLNQRGRHGPH
jgi:hypothetical protein